MSANYHLGYKQKLIFLQPLSGEDVQVEVIDVSAVVEVCAGAPIWFCAAGQQPALSKDGIIEKVNVVVSV